MPTSLAGLPLAATMDLQYRLPPPQQVLMTPTIFISLILILLAVLAAVLLYHRASVKTKRQKRKNDLLLAKKLLLKRGGTEEDFERLNFIFENHARIDPAASVMVHETFKTRLKPLLESSFDEMFAMRVERFYFPPPKDTNAIAKEKSLKKLVAQTRNVADVQAAAAMIDLMDATLRPGTVLKVTFEGVENNYECLVMNYNMQFLNVTLPANTPNLLGSLQPGMRVEGNYETGPSLMAFNTTILSIVGGSMPFCRLAVWKNAWEVRKRDSVRLTISLDVDFQHISTASSANYTLGQLDKEIGAVRPGRLVDLSLGGGCIETPSLYDFHVGDFIRFTAALIEGHPPATLLGAIVDANALDPEQHNGMTKRLHIQFLALDDVSQRLLARAMRQLQDQSTQDEWLKAQRMLTQMRQNNIAEANMTLPQGGAKSPQPGVGKRTGVTGVRGKSTTAAGLGKAGATHTGVTRSPDRRAPDTGAHKPVNPGQTGQRNRPG